LILAGHPIPEEYLPPLRHRKFLDCQLLRASKEDDTQRISDLLLMGANPRIPYRRITLPLHVAIEAGHTQVVSELLSAGADTSIQPDGMTPMDLARIISDENQNRDEIIELLKNPPEIKQEYIEARERLNCLILCLPLSQEQSLLLLFKAISH
jgi:ankyrin repeat protein